MFPRRRPRRSGQLSGFSRQRWERPISTISSRTDCDPAEEHRFYDEKIVTLPGCYQANDDRAAPSPQRPAARRPGLPEKGFVFCNFNSRLQADAADLRRLDADLDAGANGSVLWLLAAAPFADNLRPARKVTASAAQRAWSSRPTRRPDQHLARLGLADLFLDGLPVQCATPPAVTRARGRRAAADAARHDAFRRVAASLLQAAGLPELVTENADGL